MAQDKEQLTYTLILHQIRKKLKLSLMEYCIADSVYHLSNNPKSKVSGWCWASKKTMASILGTTQQTVFVSIKKLIENNIVEKDNYTRYLRTTNKWYENVVLVKASAEYQETLHPINKGDNTVSKNLTYTHKEILHNNNKDNDKYKKTVFSLKNWNDSQSSPVNKFIPEHIVGKHGVEKIDGMIKKYGKENGGFSQFMQALNK